MFRLLPPSPLGGPEPRFPGRDASFWLVVIVVVVAGGRAPEEVAMIVAMLTTVAMLALILRWTPRLG